MTYEDALQDSIDALLGGRDLESVLAAYPAHAGRLRDDLALVTNVRTRSNALPPIGNAAQVRFEAQLAAARSARSTPSPLRRSFWDALLVLPAWTRAVGLAGSAAIVALLAIALVLPGIGSNTAEASTLEGVVIENTNGTLTLQTDNGIERVSLRPGAALTDANGAGVTLASIEAGQLLRVQGKRAAQGHFIAKVLSLRTPEALQSWCVDHIARCQEASGALQQRVEQCQQTDAPPCPALRTRLQQLRNDLGNLTRLADLRNRCQKGVRTACVELISICNARPEQCAAIQGWLRTYRAGNGQEAPR